MDWLQIHKQSRRSQVHAAGAPVRQHLSRAAAIARWASLRASSMSGALAPAASSPAQQAQQLVG